MCPFSLHVSLWTSLSWKTYPSLFDASENVFCNPYQIVQMGWRVVERRCLSVTQYITVTHRGGWCCMFLMVRPNTTPLSLKCFCRNAARDQSCLFFFSFLITQPTSGWRTVRSCCPHPITPLALISHYKPLSGYATSESQTSTSSLRSGCLSCTSVVGKFLHGLGCNFTVLGQLVASKIKKKNQSWWKWTRFVIIDKLTGMAFLAIKQPSNVTISVKVYTKYTKVYTWKNKSVIVVFPLADSHNG